MGTKPGERMMGELERRAEAISGDFNAQDIANTLWAYATMGTKPGERLMGELERRAEAISGDFKSQNVANTLWAYATMGTKPGERMIGELERRAEAIAGEFNSQHVANTLWAYATMGTKPGERMIGELERRAEAIAGEFNAQDIANTLWAYATMGTKPGERLMGELERRAEAISGEFNVIALCEIHQFFIWCDLVEGIPVSFLVLKQKLGPSCKAAFFGQPVYPSVTQQQVSDTLRGMGLSVEDEFRCPKSGYSIDMRVHESAKSSTAGAAAGWAVEFDGPSHFLDCYIRPQPNGGTLMKRRILELLGYTVVSVPFWEWSQRMDINERKEYLRGKLKGDKTGGALP
jgi:hypothetical protein